jgi:uncharacterized protein (DUF2141 family)
MYFLTLIPAFFLFFFKPDHSVHITITNLDGESGDLFIGWYNRPEGFRVLDKAFYKRVVPVQTRDEAQVTFEVTPGTYAIAVFLDTNSNGKLDTNLFGAPTEPYGFSNNKLFTFRPTSFDEAAVEIRSDAQIRIALKK